MFFCLFCSFKCQSRDESGLLGPYPGSNFARPTSSLAALGLLLCTATAHGIKGRPGFSLPFVIESTAYCNRQDTIHLILPAVSMQTSAAQHPDVPTQSPFLRLLIPCILSKYLDPVEKVLHEYFPKRSHTLAKYLSWTLSNFDNKPPPPPHHAACTHSPRLGLNCEYLRYTIWNAPL